MPRLNESTQFTVPGTGSQSVSGSLSHPSKTPLSSTMPSSGPHAQCSLERRLAVSCARRSKLAHEAQVEAGAGVDGHRGVGDGGLTGECDLRGEAGERQGRAQ